ncbi:sigma-70 family RNA polymerase sigma factor [Streptomyces thermoalcalitolerans]|uniref:Sigma-70 family RNA polymerase sigma factor n=1 Tax=Streptomyces thermoalcalitolerans TaxID=65605 RepID=A0ABN1PSB3_9ACTN
MAKRDAPPHWDHGMRQRLVHGEAAALGELYDRFSSLVHGLAHRVLGNERAADHITREVFVHVWEHPEAYDPRQGSLRAWMAALTRRLALRRLHGSGTAAAPDGQRSPDPVALGVRRASAAARADRIVHSMPVPLRAALELAYFQRRDYRQTAADLGIPEDEARRRLRLGLQLLSTAHDTNVPEVPPGYGGAA